MFVCAFACVYVYMCMHSCICTQTTLFGTYSFTPNTHTQYKQNHLCLVWLGIAVAELCWAQPGHCWGFGCPVSTHTHTHTQSLSVSTLSLASRQEAAGLNIWVPLMNWNLLGVRIQWLNAIRLIFLGGWLSSEREGKREKCAWQSPLHPTPALGE